jgi:hypothetical protein
VHAHLSAGWRLQPNRQCAFRHARNPLAGIQAGMGGADGFPLEDCGNDDGLLLHGIFALRDHPRIS